MKLTPREPTPEMVDAGQKAAHWTTDYVTRVIWRAMHDAAPSGWQPIETAPLDFDGYFAQAAALIRSQAAEIAALRKFRDYFLDRCEMLYFHFGMEPVELFNACGAAIDAARKG